MLMMSQKALPEPKHREELKIYNMPAVDQSQIKLRQPSTIYMPAQAP